MSRSPSLITVRKIKLDGRTSEHSMTWIETTSDGTWLFSPAGNVVTRSNDEPYRQPGDGVQFFPVDRWFAAWCFAPAENPPNGYWTRPWIAIDIAEPAQVDLAAGQVTFVDLELDIWCADEGADIVDQDELADAERRGLITAQAADRARRIAEELVAELSVGWRHAFDGVGWRLLEQSRGAK